MIAHQLGLFDPRPPDVDIDSDDYKAGFTASWTGPRGAPEPSRPKRWSNLRWTRYLAGWRDGVRGSTVPAWRL